MYLFIYLFIYLFKISDRRIQGPLILSYKCSHSRKQSHTSSSYLLFICLFIYLFDYLFIYLFIYLKSATEESKGHLYCLTSVCLFFSCNSSQFVSASVVVFWCVFSRDCGELVFSTGVIDSVETLVRSRNDLLFVDRDVKLCLVRHSGVVQKRRKRRGNDDKSERQIKKFRVEWLLATVTKRKVGQTPPGQVPPDKGLPDRSP